MCNVNLLSPARYLERRHRRHDERLGKRLTKALPQIEQDADAKDDAADANILFNRGDTAKISSM